MSSAYEQLHAEGYFETFVGAGTCVSRSIPDDALRPAIGKMLGAARQVSNTKALRKVSRRVALMRVPAQTWSNKLVAFRVSLPALEHFPTRVWSHLLNCHSRKHDPDTVAPPCADALGFPIRSEHETNLMVCTVVVLLLCAHDWLGSHLHLVLPMRETWHRAMGRFGTICKLQPDGRRNIRSMLCVVPSL